MSELPWRSPACENGWHGGPNTYRSTGSMSATSRVRTSEYRVCGECWCARYLRTLGSASEEKTCLTFRPKSLSTLTMTSSPEKSVPTRILAGARGRSTASCKASAGDEAGRFLMALIPGSAARALHCLSNGPRSVNYKAPKMQCEHETDGTGAVRYKSNNAVCMRTVHQTPSSCLPTTNEVFLIG